MTVIFDKNKYSDYYKFEIHSKAPRIKAISKVRFETKKGKKYVLYRITVDCFSGKGDHDTIGVHMQIPGGTYEFLEKNSSNKSLVDIYYLAERKSKSYTIAFEPYVTKDYYSTNGVMIDTDKTTEMRTYGKNKSIVVPKK